MKKLFLVMAAAMLTASASAQRTAVTANKAQDNWYIGINAGAATPMNKFGDYGFFKGFAPSVGVRVGKNLTTVFGLALDANAYFESYDEPEQLLRRLQGRAPYFRGYCSARWWLQPLVW